MAIENIVTEATGRALDDLARRIESELKERCPVRTGHARDSIGIRYVSENARAVGGKGAVFFADQGNNQRVRVIRPKNAQALRFDDGSFHARARTYEGKHFFREVADMHR